MNTSKTTSMILAAAVAGLMTGATAPGAFASDSGSDKSTLGGVSAGKITLGEKSGCGGKEGCGGKKGDKASCKGKNDCKGKGGCKSGDNGCKGKNSCKGKGGCKAASGEKSDKAASDKPAETPAK